MKTGSCSLTALTFIITAGMSTVGSKTLRQQGAYLPQGKLSRQMTRG
jgi:hypothetical protein